MYVCLFKQWYPWPVSSCYAMPVLLMYTTLSKHKLVNTKLQQDLALVSSGTYMSLVSYRHSLPLKLLLSIVSVSIATMFCYRK